MAKYTVTRWTRYLILDGELHRFVTNIMFEDNHEPRYYFTARDGYEITGGGSSKIDVREGYSITGFIKKAVTDALSYRASSVDIWLDTKYDLRNRGEQKQC